MNEIARSVITIDPDFAAIWGDLDNAAYEGLKAEIISDGIRDPLVIWNPDNNHILVDGHNRLRVAKELNMMAVPVSYKVFNDKAEAAQWIFSHQSSRRNVTDGQKVLAMEAIRKCFAAAAKKEQGKRTDLWENSPKSNPEETRTRTKVAQEVGLTDWKARQGEYVLKHATEEQREDLRTGKKDLKEVFNEALRENAPKKIAEQAKEEHEAFQSKKAVTVDDIQRDKVNQNIIRNEEARKIRAELHRAASVFNTFNYLKSDDDYQHFIRYEGSFLPHIIRELMDARNGLDTIIMNLIEKGKKFGKDQRL